MSRRTILLLEDDESLGMVLREHLQMNGFEVIWERDGASGSTVFAERPFDLCLVDIMMPRKDGITFAREVRQDDVATPIIFLTAKSLREDRIEGFKAGCDDYVTKPFSIEELLLRIEAVLRRSGGAAGTAGETKFAIGGFKFDSTRQVLSRGDSERKLTTKESDLLRILCENINRTVTRESALDRVWHDKGYFAGRSMDVYISKLRKYLSDDPRVEIIGVHGEGVRLVVRD
ncbi:response regulator transcription factor [bacterium]|nr:response regulator transcription factor [bacterium]